MPLIRSDHLAPSPAPLPEGCGVPPSHARIPRQGASPAGAMPPREPPQALLRIDPVWRARCLSIVGRIPSGYTYFAQLMGHDMGHSVPLSLYPHAEPPGSPPGLAARYNLIENPLTLETIYGAGPVRPGHLYDPETLLFRLPQDAELAPLITYRPDPHSPAEGDPIRILHDERNRDTLMLHEMTIAWMQFHNRCARQLQKAGLGEWQAYAQARAHVVRVWHRLLQDDLLRRFVHPAVASLRLDDRLALDEVTLLNGLSRAFHALPLDAYPMRDSGLHNLYSLMKKTHAASPAELEWHVDWSQFLDPEREGPRTGLSLSVAGGLRLPVGAIAAMDMTSALAANPLRLGSPAMGALLATLPEPWGDWLQPAQLEVEFARLFSDAPVLPTETDLSWGPLYQALLVEAQLYGLDGGFGPFGSALLKASVQAAIGRVRFDPGVPPRTDLDTPDTLLTLITLARSPSP